MVVVENMCYLEEAALQLERRSPRDTASIHATPSMSVSVQVSLRETLNPYRTRFRVPVQWLTLLSALQVIKLIPNYTLGNIPMDSSKNRQEKKEESGRGCHFS